MTVLPRALPFEQPKRCFYALLSVNRLQNIPGFSIDRVAAAGELARLVNDDAARCELGSQARRYALADFTWPVVAEKYLEVYQHTRTAA